ncbi:MAG: glycosidase [Bacteroidetes bacterium]|nr:MAG: glycosidase [Bacteroidota bacterium]
MRFENFSLVRKMLTRSYMIVAVLLLTTLACSKDKDPEPPVVVPNDDPAQYGVPFAGVSDPADVVLYQVNIRAFSTQGNFAGVTARLDSIKSLGVNTLYLMPTYPIGVERGINSPYCISDYKAVNTEFGSLTDLRNLIEQAHNRGMAVLLDWVANHTSWDHVWMKNPTWYSRDNSGNIVSPNGWNDVAQLNFSNSDMRKEMIKAMKFWVLTANADGFRCDYADGPPIDFWKQAVDTLRNMSTRKLLLLAEGTRSQHFSVGFDFNFGFRFYDQMKKVYQQNQPASSLYAFNNSEYSLAGADQWVVRYLTNHDVNSSDGTPLDLFGGKKGSMAAFVVAAYMKGVPMIYSGQEVGTPFRITFPFTGQNINWTLNPDLVAEHKKIIGLRNQHEALRKGTLTTWSHDKAIVFTKKLGLETLLVVSNLKNSEAVVTLDATLTGFAWKDAFTGADAGTFSSLTLEPYGYKVFKTSANR